MEIGTANLERRDLLSLISAILSGGAVLRACQDAKRQLFELASVKMGQTPDDLAISDGKVYRKAWPKESIPITDLFTPLGFVKGVEQIIGRGDLKSLPFGDMVPMPLRW